MMKKTFILVMCLAIGTLAYGVSGMSGSGTAVDPFMVASEAHLQAIGTGVYSPDAHYKLAAGIQMTGSYTEAVISDFSGVFDGDGHVISDLTITGTSDHVGLFGTTENAEIRDLTLLDVSIEGGYRTAGLVGYAQTSVISGCYVTGDVSGGERVGGIVGDNWGTRSVKAAILDTVSDVNVSGAYAGGLVGHASTNSFLMRCGATGTITGGDRIGGLVGNTYGETVRVIIADCWAEGDVEVAFDAVIDYGAAGGLIGQSNTSFVSNCYASGDVKGEIRVGGLSGNFTNGWAVRSYALGNVEGGQYTGGLIGRVTTSGTVYSCYALGDAAGTDEVGGLIGGVTSGLVVNSYSAGQPSLPAEPEEGAAIGGLIGSAGATVLNSFWDEETSGISLSEGGVGKTTAQMQDPATFIAAGWGFFEDAVPSADETWLAPVVTDYMKLAWSEGKTSFAGSGTANDPYQIWSATDLERVYEFNIFAHYCLMDEIDLAGKTYDAAVIEYFGGVFDGQGEMIKNLKIDSLDPDKAGLFGELWGAAVSNLHIVDADIKGDYRTGGLAGYAAEGTTVINNCSISGTVEGGRGGAERTGGLVGDAYYTDIVNCASYADVTGFQRVGGLVGHSSTDSFVDGCYATGDISSSADAAGGLIGRPYQMKVIRNSYATGNVTAGGIRAGGLVGWTSDASLENCYATGDVTGTDQIGGLIGQLLTAPSSATNCYATGNVKGNHRVGGFIGQQSGGTHLENCYSTGTASHLPGSTGDLGAFTGGWYSTLENCFWDTETSGSEQGFGGRNASGVGNLAGKSTAEMKQEATFTATGWDFADVWMMRDGCSYPRLVWQTFALPDVDINLDGFIDIDDLRLLAAWWLVPGACADISGNGTVDLTDFAILASEWLTE